MKKEEKKELNELIENISNIRLKYIIKETSRFLLNIEEELFIISFYKELNSLKY